MYAQFASVEHSGKKGSDFCQKVSTLSQGQIFLSAESGKQYYYFTWHHAQAHRTTKSPFSLW